MTAYPVVVYYTGKTAKGVSMRLEITGSMRIEPRENMYLSARGRKMVSSVKITEVEHRSVGREKVSIIVYAAEDDRVVSYVDDIRDDFRACGWAVKEDA